MSWVTVRIILIAQLDLLFDWQSMLWGVLPISWVR